MNKIGAVILAAGEGRRLKSLGPKPLVPLLGRRLIDFPIMAICQLAELLPDHSLSINVVVGGANQESLRQHLNAQLSVGKISLPVNIAEQDKPRGTADALRAYFASIPQAKEQDLTLVVCADTPLIRGLHLQQLFQILQDSKAQAVVASFETTNPQGYGRIVRYKHGLSIVEEKDATREELKICEVNSGLYLFKTSYILQHLDSIEAHNKAAEFYLTDLFQKDRSVLSYSFAASINFQGVNDLEQLELVTRLLWEEKRSQLRQQGVRFLDAQNTYLDWDVQIGSGALIYPHTTMEGHCQLSDQVVVESGCFLRNTLVAAGAHIKANSYLEDAQIGVEAQVGPFARLRPGSILGEKAKVGNFVELKNVRLGAGAKAGHLTYIGDADIGAESNIGCGFITCNYDGVKKHHTQIGSGTFIGSDCQVVAPIEIGNEVYVAAGSTITESIPDGGFAIARSRQQTRLLMAHRFLKGKRVSSAKDQECAVKKQK